MQPNAKGIMKWFGFYNRTQQSLHWTIFFRPLKQALNLNVSMAVIVLAITFCYANIALVVEMSQAFGVLFHLNAQQLSFHYIARIIGSIIGEFLAGPLSDWWMIVCYKKSGGQRVVVDRLWVSYTVFIAVIVGLIVWGVYLDKVEEIHWKISALIGAAVAAAGNNIVATVLTTFVIDSSKFAPDVGIFESCEVDFWIHRTILLHWCLRALNTQMSRD